MPNPRSKLLDLNQDHLLKIAVMITSHIEMLQFPNFSHITRSTI